MYDRCNAVLMQIFSFEQVLCQKYVCDVEVLEQTQYVTSQVALDFSTACHASLGEAREKPAQALKRVPVHSPTAQPTH